VRQFWLVALLAGSPAFAEVGPDGGSLDCEALAAKIKQAHANITSMADVRMIARLEDRLQECEAAVQRAQSEALWKQAQQRREDELRRAEEERQRAEAERNDPKVQRAALSASICRAQAVRKRGQNVIASWRRAAKFGGVLNKQGVMGGQTLVLMAERQDKQARAELKAMKAKPLPCTDPAVAAHGTCNDAPDECDPDDVE